MKKILIALLFNVLAASSFAQLSSEYKSKNPLYWKKRLPDKAYWQQDVHYKIDARIDETTHVIEATESLEYVNNSPDTLNFVYFHLFQNAFVKGSHLHELEKAVKFKPRLGKYEAAGLGTTVSDLKVNGTAAKTELDNTVLKVYLPKPLYPGKSAKFTMAFKTYYDQGATRRRMKMYDAWGFKHYNGVQWFPKISVYDRKFGWDTYQHLNKEFYGDFGTFDISLDFPSNYVVEATGALQNRSEVLPDELRQKLDMKNFAKKPWNESPSIITPYVKGERKVWKFHAMNVHDFAFTADPSYRIATTYWNGIECVGLAQEPHAAGWQNSADYVAKIIKTFSEDVGMYAYPKMIAADAADGMEYPMLTLDGGADPGYRGLLVHEIGHNWFYGMVGSNETYRAAMDEGFTQFITAWGLRKIDGENLVQSKPKSKYRRMFYEPTNVLDARVMMPYTREALNQRELPLNTHSNDFDNALHHEGGYGMVYYKTAAMLYNLQYTLGDSLFLAAFQNYFDQWKFAHPYFEDFRNSIIQFTNVDLNWFFDQWLETTKTIDYGIADIDRAKGRDSFTIKFHRKGEMQMPIDFTVTAKDGSKHSFHIPNTWFNKKTEATTLPKWYGWSKLYPEYTAHVQIPSGIKQVQIDTTYRLADIDYEDNYKKRGVPLYHESAKFKLDGGLADPWDRRNYRMYVRPDLWYNTIDGIKAGIHLEGDYLKTLHKVSATVWFNTHVLQDYDYASFESEGFYDRYVPFNYMVSYLTPLTKRMPWLQVQVNSRLLDGLWNHRAGFNWVPNSNNKVELYGLTMWRPKSFDFDYLIYPDEWSSTSGRHNTSLNAAWTHNYKYMRGNGSYEFSARAPFLTGNGADAFNYAYAQLDARNYNTLGKLDIRTRLYARYGMGNQLPYESVLFLSGANNEELMENKYTRTNTFVPEAWYGYSTSLNHFHYGGGLNLRGYSGYLIGQESDGEILIGYKGRSGAAANVEVDIDGYIPLRPRFTRNWLHADVYAFADAGTIELSRATLPEYWNIQPTTMWSSIRMDAGLGFAFTVKKWGVFEKALPLTLRLDFPVFLNRPPNGEDYTSFRWIMGVNRTF